MKKHVLVGCALMMASAGILMPRPAQACASAIWDGESLSIAKEWAVIVWDAPHQTEYFIRRASFDTNATKMGFLVPTPQKPVITAVDPAIYDQLLAAGNAGPERKALHGIKLLPFGQLVDALLPPALPRGEAPADPGRTTRPASRRPPFRLTIPHPWRTGSVPGATR